MSGFEFSPRCSVNGGVFPSIRDMRSLRDWLWIAAGMLAAGAFVVRAAPTPTEALPPPLLEFVTRTWNHEDGLPDPWVKYLHQTRDGYLWAATRTGLARFDGVYFTVFNHGNTPEMSSDDCRALAEDRDGTLWIGTADGLLRRRGSVITRFTRQDGLVWPRVKCLLPAHDGTLWIGTEYGLGWLRNGLFQSFTHPAHLIGPEIWSLSEDADGSIWIGTSSGLQRFDPGAGKFDNSLSTPAAPNAAITGVHHDSRGRLWIVHADPENGYYGYIGALVQGKWFPDHRIAMFPGWTAASFTEEANGDFWAANLGASLFRVRRDADIRDLEGSRGYNVDLPGKPSIERVLALTLDRESSFWIGFLRSGIMSLRHRHIEAITTRNGLTNDQCWAVLESRDGSVWVGTDGGLSHFQAGRWTTLTREDGLSRNEIRALAEDRHGRLWIGTGSSIDCLDRGRITRMQFPGRWPATKVRTLHIDPQDVLWVGSALGLFTVDLKNDPPTRPSLNLYSNAVTEFAAFSLLTETNGLPHEDVRMVAADRDGALWVGTHGGGLIRIKADLARGLGAGNGATNLNSTSSPALRAPYPPLAAGDRDGERSRSSDFTNASPAPPNSSATTSGAWAPTREETAAGLQIFRATNGLASDRVWAAWQDREGVWWLAGDSGLTRLEGGKFTVFSPRDGLPDATVNAILEDDAGHLWLSHDRGITRVSKRSLDARASGSTTAIDWIHYNEEDGLLSPETNGQKSQPAACKTRDGKLWFPTTKGLAIFDPKHLPDLTNPPPVIIEQWRADGETLHDNGPGGIGPVAAMTAAALPDGPYALPPGRGHLVEFRFTAPTFIGAEKVRFRYRLVGLETQWTEAGSRRTAQYANLKPGGYRFQVTAANKYGVSNPTGAEMAFVVRPFFWQTWWFRAACVLFPALAGYAFYHQRLTHQRRLAKAERAAAVARERANIARDLHDHLGPRLTLVQKLGDSIRHARPAETSEDGAREKMARLAHELNASLDSAVWAVQPDKDSVTSLADHLGDAFQEMLSATECELDLDFPDRLPNWPLSRTARYHLSLAALEALNNAIKYARATRIQLRLATDNDTLTIEISDNGCGFDPAEPRRDSSRRLGGCGLANMRERLESLGGRFALSSQPGCGTTVTLMLPRRHENPPDAAISGDNERK